jgi:hypothetical protein
MTKPIHDSNDPQTLAALEAELRRLPAPEPPAGLEDALISAIPPAVHSSSRAQPLRWAPCAAMAAAAAAAILLVWISAVVNLKSDEKGLSAGRPSPRFFTTPSNLPQASWAAYYRAWLQSPETLDKMMERDAAARLKPESNPAGLNVRSFLETMNHIEEKPNENHSMRGCGVSSVV